MMQSFLNTLADLSELFWKNYLDMQIVYSAGNLLIFVCYRKKKNFIEDAVFSNFRNFKNTQVCYLKACNLLELFM